MGRLWGVPVPIRPPPFTSPSLPSIPSSNHPPPPPGSVCFLPRADQLRFGAGILGFAIAQQARHGDRPNRVRHPPDCSFTSGCFPPLLAETQLPSVTGLQTIPRQGRFTLLARCARERTSAALPCRFGFSKSGRGLPHSKGLLVHLRLLPTSPRGDPVTFGYGASDYTPAGTSSLLARCARERTTAVAPATAHW